MKRIWKLLRQLLAAVCFVLAVQAVIQVRQSEGNVTAFLEKTALDASAAQQLCAQEQEQETPRLFCFWGEQPEVVLECRETGKSSRTAAVLTAGNPELVIRGTDRLQFLENGCFLDAETAQELFGTKNAAGQNVWWNGKRYTVCGTFESLRRMALRPAENADGAVLSAASLAVSEKENASGAMEQFLLRCGMSGKSVDFSFLSAFIWDLLLIYPMILFIRLAGLLLKKPEIKAADAKQNSSKLPELFRWLSAAVLFITFLWAVKSLVRIPKDMIPTRWSDFSFWSNWWETQRRNLLLLLGSAQGEAQLSMLWNVLCAFLFEIAAIFCSI